MSSDDQDEVKYGKLRVLVAAVVGIVGAFAIIGYVSWQEVFHEGLFRVAPTVRRQGVGSDWVIGNTVPWLDFLISLVHAADVIMGGFILIMVFIHWASFRRLGERMRDPDQRPRGDELATDGGAGEADATAGANRGTEAGGEAR